MSFPAASCFINIGPGIQKLIRWGYTYTHRQQADIISPLAFFSKYEK
jgi:hypothetical protein